jgi:hypothetical protein
MHSDVGGGYPDDGLAYVSLEWMMKEAAHYGQRFCEKIRAQYIALADENGPIHDSRHGVAGYYRYKPRRIDELAHQKSERKTNVEIGRSKIHESALRRIKTGHDGYSPFVMPSGFAVVKFNGSIEDGATYAGPQVVTTEFAAQHEHVWNWVWWRRAAYFFTLLWTLALVVMPLILPALPKGACTSRLCFFSYAIDLVAAFLPSFATTWTDSFSSHPNVFFVIAVLVVLGLASGGVLERQVRDLMRTVWYSVPKMNPHQRKNFSSKQTPSRLNRAIEWLRTRAAYKAFFHFLTREFAPFVFLVAVGYGVIAIASQVTFAVRSSSGGVCAGTGAGDLKLVEVGLPAIRWQTRNLCKGTGVELLKGATYRLRFTIPASAPWLDSGVSSGPNGIQPEYVTLGMSIGVPLRRHLGQPWFKPMARINNRGTDFYPLDPKPTVPDLSPSKNGDRTVNKEVVFETEIIARTQGELFLYVNDAVFQVPFYPESALWFYNNKGEADVRIELVQTPSRTGENPGP